MIIIMIISIAVAVVMIAAAVIIILVLRRAPVPASVAVELAPDYFDLQNEWLVEQFSSCNVIVAGKKGTGKDLLFAHVIHLRGEKHYSNIPYNDLTEVRSPKELNIGGNSYLDLINNTVKKFDPVFEDGIDYYLSDAGTVFPSQYNSELDKMFTGIPSYFALSRHLYNSNVHANIQNFGRLWNKLREQADCYIRVRSRKKFDTYILVNVISYESYNSAEVGLLPNSDPAFAERNGNIVERNFKIYKSYLKYDTRHFRKVLLNVPDEPEIIEEAKRKIHVKIKRKNPSPQALEGASQEYKKNDT